MLHLEHAPLSGSSYDRQRGSDPAHANSEGGAEAYPGVPAPAVSLSFLAKIFTRDLNVHLSSEIYFADCRFIWMMYAQSLTLEGCFHIHQVSLCSP